MGKVEKQEFYVERIVFEVNSGDGVTPTRRKSDGCFELRAPYDFTLAPGLTMTIRLGVKCNHALHVIPAWEKLSRKLELVDGIWAAQDATQELTVTVKNTGTEVYFGQRGELVARAASLACSAPSNILSVE